MFLLLLSLTVLKDNFVFYYFFTSQILGAMAADLLYKSMPGLCLIISGVARYLPKPALNNIPSLCVYYNLYGSCIRLDELNRALSIKGTTN